MKQKNLWIFSVLYILIGSPDNFRAQVETYCVINSPSNFDGCISQYGVKSSPTGAATSGQLLGGIFTNNLYANFKIILIIWFLYYYYILIIVIYLILDIKFT